MGLILVICSRGAVGAEPLADGQRRRPRRPRGRRARCCWCGGMGAAGMSGIGGPQVGTALHATDADLPWRNWQRPQDEDRRGEIR